MSAQSDVKAKSLNAEFPGLNEVALRVFGVDYESCTPNLREHCKLIAKKDAAVQMYETLRLTVVSMSEQERRIAQNAIEKAEGRI